MSKLICPVATVPVLYNTNTAAALAHHLVTPQDAKDSDIVAICHDYRNTLSGPYRDETPTVFITRRAGALSLHFYDALDAPLRAAMAHIEMLLQGDETQRSAACGPIYDLEDDNEDTATHRIVCLPDAIGVIKFGDTLDPEDDAQEYLDETVRLVLPHPTSHHDAIKQHAALARLLPLWRQILELHIDGIEWADLRLVHAGQLLEPTG